MSRRLLRILASAIVLWMVASVSLTTTGISVPGLVNYVHEIEYGCSEPTVVDSIWIRPCVNNSSSALTIPLLYSSNSSGPPFTIGVTVLDYETDNNNRCLEVVVNELIVTVDGERTSMLSRDKEISSSFNSFTGNAMKADCYVDLGELVSADNSSPISLEAKLKIHMDNRVIDQAVSGSFKRGGWQGTWFIFEALFPHA